MSDVRLCVLVAVVFFKCTKLIRVKLFNEGREKLEMLRIEIWLNTVIFDHALSAEAPNIRLSQLIFFHRNLPLIDFKY